MNNPLMMKARKLENQAHSVESAIDVSHWFGGWVGQKGVVNVVWFGEGGGMVLMLMLLNLEEVTSRCSRPVSSGFIDTFSFFIFSNIFLFYYKKALLN